MFAPFSLRARSVEQNIIRNLTPKRVNLVMLVKALNQLNDQCHRVLNKTRKKALFPPCLPTALEIK